MARVARVVVPGYPHHVTQRGSRKQKTFFSADDYHHYRWLLGTRRRDSGLQIWAWCLMPNHVHLVVVPDHEKSLARFCADVHRRYAYRTNTREGWRGHLWQERFRSFVMDEEHLLAAVRYVELNPVRAGLCETPTQWPWSSVHAHLAGRSDDVVSVEPMLQRISDWHAYLAAGLPEPLTETLRRHTRTGRPAGDAAFLSRMEKLTGRRLRKGKPGPKGAGRQNSRCPHDSDK